MQAYCPVPLLSLKEGARRRGKRKACPERKKIAREGEENGEMAGRKKNGRLPEGAVSKKRFPDTNTSIFFAVSVEIPDPQNLVVIPG